MEDILQLTKMEQLDIYKGVIDLIKNRLEKARSVENV
jgi:hypothetical protein